MTLKPGEHHIRISQKLWDFFEKRKARGYGPVQSQINIILTTIKEKSEQEERKSAK